MENPVACCGVKDPEINLPWFKALTEEINASWTGSQDTYIQHGSFITNVGQGSHLEIPVFIVQNCCPNCSSAIFVYDCDGNLICNFGSGSTECLNGFVTLGKVIWKSSQNGCLFW